MGFLGPPQIEKLKKKGDVDGLIEALRQGEPSRRRAAAEALGELGDPRAVEPLIAALDDDETDFKAVDALGELGDPRAVEPLISRLDDEGMLNRVCGALGKLGDERAVPALRARLEDPSAGMFDASFITPALEEIGGPEAEKALAESGEDSGGLMGGLLAKTLAGPLASMAGMPASEEMAPGSFSVKVVGTYFDAEQAVRMGGILEAVESGYDVLAVMAVERPDGTLSFQAKDASGNTRDLAELEKPAVLVVARDTLPHLKSDERLWARVHQVEEAESNPP